jgi:hypothetical protein
MWCLNDHMRRLFLIGCIVLINLEAFSQQIRSTIITEESTDLKNWDAVSTNTYISINTNYINRFRINSVLLSATQSLQNFSTAIERTIDMNNWTPCAENSFPVTNPSCFYRLKTISDVVNSKQFSNTLAVPAGERWALFDNIGDQYYEQISLYIVNTSAGIDFGIPLLNPVLFFDPMPPTYDEGGYVGIYLNNTIIAYIQFNSRYCGHSFGIRLTDNGPILAYDSYGREFKVPSLTGDYVQYKITLP